VGREIPRLWLGGEIPDGGPDEEGRTSANIIVGSVNHRAGAHTLFAIGGSV
jgi:hypothetical protein